MSEWREVRLGDVLDDVTVGHVGSMTSEYRDSGVVFLRSQDVKPHRIDLDGVRFVSPEFHARLIKSRLLPGDVITVRTGKPGTSAVVPDDLGEANCADLVISRPGPAVDSRWLAYFLNSVADTQVATLLVGAVQQHFNVGAMRDLRVRMPDLRGQRAIADVLGALDDKIEVNRKLAATADDLVRAEFDSILTSATQRVAVSELVRNARDTVQPSAEEQEYVGLEHLPRRHMWLDCVPEPTEISSVKSRFVRGDILFGKLRPNLHKVVSAPVSGICSTEILVLRAVEADFAGYVLAACSSDLVLREVTRATEGTRMPRTNWKQLSAVKIPWPGDDHARQLSGRIEAVRDAIEGRLRENTHLNDARDTLLPKLMSGQLRVEEAREMVSA